MKKIITVLVVLILSDKYLAQNPVAVGQGQFNAGLGFASNGIPVYVGYDHGIHKDITLGGELSFRSYHDNWNGNGYSHSGFGITANGNYHFNWLLKIPLKWDLYAGPNAGFIFWSSSDDYGGTKSSGIYMGFQTGGRYYFTEKFGINAELSVGNSMSGGKFGISLKL